jgi:hypothetical protein
MSSLPLRAAFLALASIALVPAVTAQGKVQAGGGEGERKSASMYFFSQSEGGFQFYGNMELTFGAPEWKDEYGAVLDQAKAGTRLRLGNNFWTTLDSSVAFDAGGKTVEAGDYYLAIEITRPNTAALVLLDPAEMRKKKAHSGMSDQTKGGTLVPLEWTEVEETAEHLQLSLVAEDPAQPEKVALVIRFGNHQLRAVLDARLETGKAKK